MTEESPSTPKKKVIEGGIDAKASPATSQTQVQAEPVFVREVMHHRITGPVTHTIVEYVAEHSTAELPQEIGRFNGLGTLQATRPDPATGQQVPWATRNFRFLIPAPTIEDAWTVYDAVSKAANEREQQRFRQDIARQTQGNKLVLPPASGVRPPV